MKTYKEVQAMYNAEFAIGNPNSEDKILVLGADAPQFANRESVKNINVYERDVLLGETMICFELPNEVVSRNQKALNFVTIKSNDGVSRFDLDGYDVVVDKENNRMNIYYDGPEFGDGPEFEGWSNRAQ